MGTSHIQVTMIGHTLAECKAFVMPNIYRIYWLAVSDVNGRINLNHDGAYDTVTE